MSYPTDGCDGPSMIRVDAHHHVWRLDRDDYGWLRPTPALRRIYRDFDFDELRPQLAKAGVTATVLVQAAPTVAETQLSARGRARERRPRARRRRLGRSRGARRAATLGTARARFPLEECAADAAGRRRRGVDPAAGRPACARGDAARWACVSTRWSGRATCARCARCSNGTRTSPSSSITARSPTSPPVCGCHGPTISRPLPPTATHIANFRAWSTEAGAHWNVAQLQRYTDHVLTCFGSERVIWGSDWPVLTLAASYAAWSTAADALLAALSPPERAAVRGGNAVRFYGLDASVNRP